MAAGLTVRREYSDGTLSSDFRQLWLGDPALPHGSTGTPKRKYR